MCYVLCFEGAAMSLNSRDFRGWKNPIYTIVSRLVGLWVSWAWEGLTKPPDAHVFEQDTLEADNPWLSDSWLGSRTQQGQRDALERAHPLCCHSKESD